MASEKLKQAISLASAKTTNIHSKQLSWDAGAEINKTGMSVAVPCDLKIIISRGVPWRDQAPTQDWDKRGSWPVPTLMRPSLIISEGFVLVHVYGDMHTNGLGFVRAATRHATRKGSRGRVSASNMGTLLCHCYDL